MKTFKRLKDIFLSHVHSTLDSMEDPEKMISLLIAELDEKTTSLRTQIVASTAELADLRKELAGIDGKIARWEERARLAVDKGRDDMAREALLEKKNLVERQSVVSSDISQVEGIIASQKEQLGKMTDKMQEIQDKKRSFTSRAVRAKQKKEVAKVLAETDGTSIMERFSAMESKIERMEADAEVAGWETKKASPETTFAQMERDEEVEKELLELKAGLIKKAPRQQKPEASQNETEN